MKKARKLTASQRQLQEDADKCALDMIDLFKKRDNVEGVCHHYYMDYSPLKCWFSQLMKDPLSTGTPEWVLTSSMDIMQIADRLEPKTMNYYIHSGRINLYRLARKFAPELEPRVWAWIQDFDPSYFRRMIINLWHRTSPIRTAK